MRNMPSDRNGCTYQSAGVSEMHRPFIWISLSGVGVGIHIYSLFKINLKGNLEKAQSFMLFTTQE